MNNLSFELLFQIFEFVPQDDLHNLSIVCKHWNLIVSKLNTTALMRLFPSIDIIDENIWRKHVDSEKFGLDLSFVPFINTRALTTILPKAVFFGHSFGLTLLTLPKGLTLSKLIEIAKSSLNGKRVKMSSNLRKAYGDSALQRTEHVIITNSILKKSLYLSAEEHKRFLDERSLEMPELLPLATLCVLSHIASKGESLRYQRKFSRVKEKIKDSPICVGNFEVKNRLNCEYRVEDIGTGAMWRSC